MIDANGSPAFNSASLHLNDPPSGAVLLGGKILRPQTLLASEAYASMTEQEQVARRRLAVMSLLPENSAARQLIERPQRFDFFQAVKLTEQLHSASTFQQAARTPIRFRSAASTAFPASAIVDLQPIPHEMTTWAMTVAFWGLTGPLGVLPRHVDDLLRRLEIDLRGSGRNVLRDWFDLFNDRLLSLFYGAWKKYRFDADPCRYRYVPKAMPRPAHPLSLSLAAQVREKWLQQADDYIDLDAPESHTTLALWNDAHLLPHALLALMGIGGATLRERLEVPTPRIEINTPIQAESAEANARFLREAIPPRVADFALLRYSGYFAARHRPSANLEKMLAEYFSLPVRVRPFVGQWLPLDASSQTRLGASGRNFRLGVDAVAGQQIWDRQSKFRVQVGPIGWEIFRRLLPSASEASDLAEEGDDGAGFSLLCQLARFYAGPTFDFDVQLILRAEEVPRCRLTTSQPQDRPRLGWNTWFITQPRQRDADEVIFAANA